MKMIQFYENITNLFYGIAKHRLTDSQEVI